MTIPPLERVPQKIVNNLMLNVSFLPGTSILGAAIEAKELAQKLDVAFITFDFNGVKISIGQSANLETVEEKYTWALEFSGSIAL